MISVSQVSVAIPHLTPQCSSLLQHCHGNNKFSCSHKFAQSFLWPVLSPWNCTAGCASKRKNFGKEKLETWPVAIGVGWAAVPPWSGTMDKPPLLPVSSVTAGARQSLDTSKAWRGSSLGLCWVGFLAQILCFLDTGGRGCPKSAVTPQEMAWFPHQHDGNKDNFPSSSAAVFDNLDHSLSLLSHRFRIL